VSTSQKMPANDFLPEPLPANPFPTLSRWFNEARAARAQPNPDAMVLASVDAQGSPSARVVLCKQLVVDPGYLVFFTNYQSRKGQQLLKRPQAAAVFHWDAFSRQVRVEGRVLKSPVRESDEYFAVRMLDNRLSAWASDQSKPLTSRAQLQRQMKEIRERFGIEADTQEAVIPRPPHWGGFRLWPESVELWIEGPGRVHDRAVWGRTLTPLDEFSFTSGAWQSTRLHP
jgi:pyridoxamine 5'-phosphate oxidase